jgi:hypothetical protein
MPCLYVLLGIVDRGLRRPYLRARARAPHVWLPAAFAESRSRKAHHDSEGTARGPLWGRTGRFTPLQTLLSSVISALRIGLTMVRSTLRGPRFRTRYAPRRATGSAVLTVSVRIYQGTRQGTSSLGGTDSL